MCVSLPAGHTGYRGENSVHPGCCCPAPGMWVGGNCPETEMGLLVSQRVAMLLNPVAAAAPVTPGPQSAGTRKDDS